MNVISIDKTAPGTTDNAPVGWSNQDVTVTLTASDSGSGILSTYYTVDGGTQQNHDLTALHSAAIESRNYLFAQAGLK